LLVTEIDEKERARLTEIIQDHHGTVADDAGRATHILHPTPDSYTPTDDYITPVERRDKQCLVHYWGFPDSYDTWIPGEENSTAWQHRVLMRMVSFEKNFAGNIVQVGPNQGLCLVEFLNPVVPNRGSIHNAWRCRELICFFNT